MVYKEEKFGKYEIISALGEGATAFVYHARDTQLKREVALKVLKSALVADGTAFERFMQEAQAAANLFHPHIATVLDMGEAEGRYYIAMRYVAGKSLDKVLGERCLSWEDTLKLAGQIGAALDFAHGKGFIHRDIKPSNIILDEDGDFWLTDFGLTRAMMSTGLTSHTGAVLGTPAYIAPEIWQGEAAKPTTDLYALASVVVEALTGRPLFHGDTPPAVMKKHFDPLELPVERDKGVPDGINAVLEKALAKEPQERWPEGSAFIQALMDLEYIGEDEEAFSGQQSAVGGVPGGVEDESLQASPRPEIEEIPLDTEKSDTPKRRWQPWAGLGAAAALVGLCGLVVYLLTRSPSPEVVVETVVVEVTSTAAEVALQPTATQTALPDTTTPTLPSTATPIPPSPTAPQLSIGATQISGVDGMVQVYVPAGEFQMGSEDGDSDESPEHTVNLDAFWIDQTEITNAMFTKFVADTDYETDAENKGWSYAYLPESGWDEVDGADWKHPQGPSSDLEGLDDHPVVHVSWNDAQAYCEWAGKRLPTEAEWEKSARSDDGRVYPWGDNFDCTKGNFDDEKIIDDYVVSGGEGCDGFNRTAPVGSYLDGASLYGSLDMAGNVWEWVADWYGEDYYENSPSNNPEGPEAGHYRVLRGGSWVNDDGSLRSANRYGGSPGFTDYYGGFRCARSP